jgi:hypothetical protein
VREDPVDLLNELPELDDAVRDHTKGLAWFSGIAVLGGMLSLSLPLVIGGIAGGAAVWAMRHRKLAWVGAASVIIVSSLTAHELRMADRPWDGERWLDLAIVIALIVDLIVATWSLIRYRAADRQIQRLLRRSEDAPT